MNFVNLIKLVLLLIIVVLMSHCGRAIQKFDIDIDYDGTKEKDDTRLNVYSSTNVPKSIVKEAREIAAEVFNTKTKFKIDSTVPEGSNVFRLNLDVKQLEWNIPNYGEIIMQGVCVGAMGGAIGGAVYGSCHYANIYGIGDVLITIGKGQKDTTISYRDTVQFESDLNNCDSGKTKARARGMVLKRILTRILQDIYICPIYKE